MAILFQLLRLMIALPILALGGLFFVVALTVGGEVLADPVLRAVEGRPQCGAY